MDEGTKQILFQSLWRVAVFSITSFITIKILMKHMDPTNKRKDAAAKKAKELLQRLGIKKLSQLSEYELMIATHLVDPEAVSVSWDNIGGLRDTIDEIKETVIMPVKRRDLFADSQLTKPPKGVLLHGPPGCGKTMIAKATAHEAGCNFINLDVSLLTDKWYGESQKLASAVFSLAHKIQPCIVFIDEIDSFLRNRNVQDHEATAMMKAQFMTLWDGLDTDPDSTVIIMGATNRPHDLDQAIRRRMPATFHIKLPGLSQREDILRLIMRGEPIADNVNLQKLAVDTEGFSGSDLRELCRSSAIYRVRDFIRSCESSQKPSTLSKTAKGDMSLSEDQEEFVDTLRPITMEDLSGTLRKMKQAKVSSAPFL